MHIKAEPIDHKLDSKQVIDATPAVVLAMRSPLTRARLVSESFYSPGLAAIHSYKIRHLAPESRLYTDRCDFTNDVDKENLHPKKRRRL